MDRSARFAWFVVAVSVGVLAALWVAQRPTPDVVSVLFWITLLAAVELLPMSMGFEIELTMGFVIILPVVILFPPPVAMLIVGLGSVDLFEFRGHLPLHKALFNRAQSMLAAAAASIPFTVLDLGSFSLAGIALAAIIHIVVNLGLVAVAVMIERRAPLLELLQQLVPRPVLGFVLTYGLLTGLGAASALVYSREGGGGWAVAAILIPLLFARLSILGARNQQELSERLRKQQQALLEATERIFQAREHERRTIAATIHDSSLQSLAGAAYACGNAGDALVRGDTAAAAELLATARRAIDEATTSIRGSVVDLRKSSVEEGGLMETIRKFSDNVATLWDAKVHIEGDVAHEPPLPVSLAAFQILQEGLINSLKHAGTASVTVRVTDTDGKLQIVVEDDGAGFDPATELGDEQVGVDLMKERAATVRGSVELESAPGRGTRLVAVLPSGVER